MRATYLTGHGGIRCDVCAGTGNSTHRILVHDASRAVGEVGDLLANAVLATHVGKDDLALDACPSCVSKIARRCEVCGEEKKLDRDHCADCSRAFATVDRHGAKAPLAFAASGGVTVDATAEAIRELQARVAALTAQETTMAKTLEEIKALIAQRDQQHAETLHAFVTAWLAGKGDFTAWVRSFPADIRERYCVMGGDGHLRDMTTPSKRAEWAAIDAQEAAQRAAAAPESVREQINHLVNTMTATGFITSKTTAQTDRDTATKETTTMTTKTDKPDLRSELDDAAWQAGVELFTEEARTFLAEMLTDGMTEDEAAVARPLFAKAFAGRFGVPIVAGAIGGVQHALAASGVEVPVVSPAVAARIGREMRVLTGREVIKIGYRSGRDLLAKHGGRMLDAITNLGKIAERTGVRVESTADEPAEAATESNVTRLAQRA